MLTKPQRRSTATLTRWIAFYLILAEGFFVQATSVAGKVDTASSKIDLRVIYFGHPQSPRAKDFVGFLEKHFSKVGQGDLDTFRESEAAGYDVTILDYDELKVVTNYIQMPKTIVSKQYLRPTVTIGATGALVCERLGLKTGYL
ncbi:MAG: hypothetical protein ACLQU3_13045 [Limisphaerales bacterium]